MNWFTDLLWKETIAHTLLVYSLVIATGVALGKIRIRGISLGITFVLFAGIAAGHFGFKVDHATTDFIKDFGLILFVYSIGLQVGPGFFSSFKKGGLSLNLLATGVVLLGGLMTLVLHYISGRSLPMLVGVMSGAVTNTPGLGAAQQALRQVTVDSAGAVVPEIGVGYAIAYPFGVVGIILTMILLQRAGRVNLANEVKDFEKVQHPEDVLPEKITLKVTNPALFNRTIRELTQKIQVSLIISRVSHAGVVSAATADTVIRENDLLLVVAEKGDLAAIVNIAGEVSTTDLSSHPGTLVSRQLIVTRREVFGKMLGSLQLRRRFNINITRVYRAGIELVASPNLRLQMGDKLTVVGDLSSIEQAGNEVGNSLKRLYEPNMILIFTGILLGIILGSVPIMIPGIPNPFKLGLAGGPLIVAILISKFGYRFSFTAYTTPSANLMLRETGIVLFLASVGIKAGETFIPGLLSADGVAWLSFGALITLVPILVMGMVARFMLKKNFIEICGLLAGSMTDPPALAYANGIAQSEAPAVAYATVYPLVMFLRIFIAQGLILFFM
jgi:putative transport protein